MRTQTKQLRSKEKIRKKCEVRFSVIKNNRFFQKNYMRIGVRKLLRAWFLPERGEDRPLESRPQNG